MILKNEFHDHYRVVPISRFAQGEKWRIEAMRSYRQPVLIWFTKGQGRITINGQAHGYGPHNAIFLPPGTMHGFSTVGTVFGNIVFLPADMASEFPETAQHLRFRDVQRQAQLTALIDTLQGELKSDLPDTAQALRCHSGLLAVWLNRQVACLEGDCKEAKRRASHRLVSGFCRLVERDFKTPKTVADYATELGVTPTHLSRVCNECAGKSASAFLADRVHFEARKLLRETRLPVQEIARMLGFSSAAYFTRAFHKITGQSPSAFRHGGNLIAA